VGGKIRGEGSWMGRRYSQPLAKLIAIRLTQINQSHTGIVSGYVMVVQVLNSDWGVEGGQTRGEGR
jgi:hypothetical protein